MNAEELKKILDLHKRWLNGFDDRAPANLGWADLRGADLRGADLRGADLRGADLREADLRGADLTPIRDDLWAVLSATPHEVPALREAIANGRINGSTYDGPCACLVGTLAKAKGCKYTEIPGLSPASERAAERFFLAINIGDTPDKSEFAKLALEWVDLWLANVRTLVG